MWNRDLLSKNSIFWLTLKCLKIKLKTPWVIYFFILEDAKLLIQHLIYMNLIDEAELLRNEVREYIEVFSTY